MGHAITLVMDNDAEFVAVLVSRLKRQGLDAVGLDSWPAALTCLEREQVEIVLADLGTSGRDGLSVVEEIKARRPSTEIVLMSKQPSPEDLAGLRAGAFDLLLKPTGLEIIVARILEARERGRLLRAAAESGRQPQNESPDVGDHRTEE